VGVARPNTPNFPLNCVTPKIKRKILTGKVFISMIIPVPVALYLTGCNCKKFYISSRRTV
jgi:hypothetical protein